MTTRSVPKTDHRYTALQLLLAGGMLFTGGFGAKLFAGAMIIAINPEAHTGADVGSRAFFMGMSGITLAAFAIGFAMMIAEVRTYLSGQRR